MSDRQSPEASPSDPEDSAASDSTTPDPSAPEVVEETRADPSQFSTVTMHFYRGETDRMATWRSRLDQTTNWAVVVMAAILTWAFSSPDNPHYVLLIGAVAVGAFGFIEANRYQVYDAWRARVRTVEANFLAPVFAGGDSADANWRVELGSDLQDPELQLPIWEAVGHRLHRVYFLLLSVLLTAWVARITVFEPGTPWHRTAEVTGIPGTMVVGAVGLVYLGIAGLTVWSVRQATKREFDDTDDADHDTDTDADRDGENHADTDPDTDGEDHHT